METKQLDNLAKLEERKVFVGFVGTKSDEFWAFQYSLYGEEGRKLPYAVQGGLALEMKGLVLDRTRARLNVPGLSASFPVIM